MTQQQLHGPQIAGSTIDECPFGPSKGVRAEKVRVEANRCNAARDKPSILPGRHAAVVITTATEQKFARLLARGFDVIVDRCGASAPLTQTRQADRSSSAALQRDRSHTRSVQRPQPEVRLHRSPVACYRLSD